MNLILALVLLVLALAGVVIRKTYYFLPVHELKRQAKKPGSQAAELYQVVAYGRSLRSLLWLFIGLTAAGSFILFARSLPVWASLIIVGPLLWAAFSWLPSSRTSSFGMRLTLFATPPIKWLLNYLHPSLSRASYVIDKRLSKPTRNDIFEREDLLKLVEKLENDVGNRLSPEELEIVKRALTFDQFKVSDILIPRKSVKTVLASDTVGPILIDELHKSGQDYVLVKDKPKGMVVGSLQFNKLGIDSKGKVKDLMSQVVYYLHEQDSLREALHAFFVTNHALFVVVNSFEEFIGIITVEDMVKQLLGHIPGDDFTEYSDMVAVAARHSNKSEATDASVKTDEKMVE